MASNPILETIYETAEGLHKAGVMDVATMREFDALCSTLPVPYQRTFVPLRGQSRTGSAEPPEPAVSHPTILANYNLYL